MTSALLVTLDFFFGGTSQCTLIRVSRPPKSPAMEVYHRTQTRSPWWEENIVFYCAQIEGFKKADVISAVTTGMHPFYLNIAHFIKHLLLTKM